MMRLKSVLFMIVTCKCSGTSLFESSPVGRFLRESFGDSSSREIQGLPTLDDIVLTDPDLTTLKVAFEASGLIGELCPKCNYTLFAPNNDAFADFNQDFLKILLTPSWILHLQNLLSFHVTKPTQNDQRLLTTDFVDGQSFDMLNNETVTATVVRQGIILTSPLTNGSNIIEADILASNGAVDKVDAVLSPGYFGVDVFALAKVNEELSIMDDLLASIGLLGIPGEFTILAPTNDAFLALGNDTLTALLEDKDELGNVLVNHIIIGVYPSVFLKDGLIIQSLGGFNITVTVTNETITFNDGTVVEANILASNGIAHAIDMVLLNPDLASNVPSETPSSVPSGAPSTVPSNVPSSASSIVPSNVPNCDTSTAPNGSPSTVPSEAPSGAPSNVTSNVPSGTLSTVPSNVPSDSPTYSATISTMPSDLPSTAPSMSQSEPSSIAPSAAPSDSPSDVFSATPSQSPSDTQSVVPSETPSDAPSDAPSDSPSDAPSSSEIPTSEPSSTPSDSPIILKKRVVKKPTSNIKKSSAVKEASSTGKETSSMDKKASSMAKTKSNMGGMMNTKGR
jgi:uncharacterized surface protein with fasciclin (FAS1) repeats